MLDSRGAYALLPFKNVGLIIMLENGSPQFSTTEITAVRDKNVAGSDDQESSVVAWRQPSTNQ